MLNERQRSALSDAINELKRAEDIADLTSGDAPTLAQGLGYAEAKINTALELLRRIEAERINQ